MKIPGFVESILSTKKQRQIFSYARNLSSIFIGFAAYKYSLPIIGDFAIIILIASIIISYKTISIPIALTLCFLEQLFSSIT